MSVSINGTGSITGIDQGFNVTSGSVGIGTDDPSAKLEVKSTGATAVFNSGAANDGRLEFEYNSSRVGLLAYHSDRLEIQTDSSKDFTIRTNGANERLRITSAGKVGIRTDNPKQVLSVVGRATFDQAGDYYGAWINGDSTADSSFNVGAWYNVGGRLRDNGNHVVLESMNTSHYVQLQPSGGNVGVGEAGPSTKLHITKDNDIAYTPDQATQNSNNQLKIENHSTTTDSFVSMAMRARACDFHLGVKNNGGDNSGRFFLVHQDTTNKEVVSVTSAGKVGINESNPDQALHVKDADGDTVPARIESTGAQSRLGFQASGTPTSYHVSCGAEANNFIVHTNNAERLRITSDGKFGIGTDNPQYTLDLGESSSTIRLVSENNGTAIRIGAGGGGNNVTLFRVDGNTTVAEDGESNDSNYGFSLKYMGARSGNDNSLSIFPDNSTGTQFEAVTILQNGYFGINNTSPDTTLHISKSAAQNDTHGMLKVESTNTGTGSQTNAGIIAKNRYGWSQFMQWEENGLRIGSRSTTTGGDGKVTVTYGSDSTGAVINENGVVTMPQQCGFHVVLHTSQTLTNNGTVNLWDTDASNSRSYIKNVTFNAGRFVAPVAGLYYFTAQLLLSGVQSNDDNIHIAWTTGSGNDTFAYWNTRHDGASANGSYGYGGYLPVTGSTTVYLAANAIFGIRANFTGGIGIHGTDANWGHWSGFLVG